MSPAGPPLSPPPASPPEPPKPATDAKPPPTTAPATVDKDAWRDLPAAVALAVPASTDAGQRVALGQVHLSPGQPCSLKLLGGEDACRGSQAIVLRAVSGETVERHWGIAVRGSENGSETEIARLAVGDDGTLGLEWQPAAVTHPAAPQLANCVLSLESAGESHRMLLREAAQVDELVVDLEKPTHEGEWKLEAVPNAEAVKVEFLGLGGLKYSVEPAGPAPAEKGEVWVQIEDGGTLLLLRVETRLTRSFRVDITPHIRLTPEAKPERLIFKKLPQLQAQVTANHQQLLLAAQQLRFAPSWSAHAPGTSRPGTAGAAQRTNVPGGREHREPPRRAGNAARQPKTTSWRCRSAFSTPPRTAKSTCCGWARRRPNRSLKADRERPPNLPGESRPAIDSPAACISARPIGQLSPHCLFAPIFS